MELNNEAIQELAAEKIADELIGSSEDVEFILDKKISNHLDEKLSKLNKTIEEKVNDRLEKELEALIHREYVPVDIFGDPSGEPISIRDQLHAQAKRFWEVKVDPKGEPTTYGGEPRYKHMYQELLRSITREEITKTVKDNLSEVAMAFRDALAKGAKAEIDHHLQYLFKK